jgi:hypothetical protein
VEKKFEQRINVINANSAIFPRIFGKTYQRFLRKAMLHMIALAIICDEIMKKRSSAFRSDDSAQGDQIGRIFDYWPIIYFRQFLGCFFHGKKMYKF